MKQFIELELVSNEKILININHIVSVKEIILNSKSVCKILLSNSKSLYMIDECGVDKKPTKYIIEKDLTGIQALISLDDLKELIKKAIYPIQN